MIVQTHIQLNSDTKIPVVGFGTWQAAGEKLEAALNWALEAGYRHIDTAAAYQNEKIIGKVIEEWISAGKISREELFIVTKLPVSGHNPKEVDYFVSQSLNCLRLKYIDLYLIHVPFALKGEGADIFDKDGFVKLDNNNDHIATWKALESNVKSGKLKSIGLSNFNQQQIERIWNNCEIYPSNLQIEMHILHQQKTLLDYCKTKGIAITAYSSLGTRDSVSFFNQFGCNKQLPNLLGHPDVLKVSQRFGRTPAQILLRFLLEKGVIVIPKSTSKENIANNLQLFDFELDDDSTKTLEKLDQGGNGRILDFSFFKGCEQHPEYPFHTK